MGQKQSKASFLWRKRNAGISNDDSSTSKNINNISRSGSVVSMSYKTLTNLVDDNNLSEFRNFLENRGVSIDDKDEVGSTVLHYAATQGKYSFVKELLEHGATPDAIDGDNWTPLLCAAKAGHRDVCEELLNYGANMDHRDMGGWNALMWACYKGRQEVVQALVDRGIDTNSFETYHITPLIWAAGRGYAGIVDILLSRGAKVNFGDKYGTTPLIWACRKGQVEIVRNLLNAGANVDVSGVYSWTPLSVATMRNHLEIVNMLLEHKPNVNTVDSEGCTPLTVACKEGYLDIAIALLNAGAFINSQDRNGDTNIIHATRNGHYGIVEALLKKYADVNICGKDHKTPAYIAAEKGHVSILKLLLNANPDLEIPTKDGDTVLLRAVRSRSFDMVKLLLDKKVRVDVADKKGDTALHIAIRSSAKNIVELLLRNPSNGQLLYRPNRDGETPYAIDLRRHKPVLSQVYGANRLNTNEDNEDILGYDLYSSTLADMLSAPSVSLPITVGLYARWGSGKNFLLKNLTEEMKVFAQNWITPFFRTHIALLLIIVHLSLVFSLLVFLATRSLLVALITEVTIVAVAYMFLAIISYGSTRWDYFRNLNSRISARENTLRMIFKLLFCRPPGIKWNDCLGSKPIRFYFTDHNRVSSTVGGENAVVQMIGSLFDHMEQDLGVLPARLYRAFTPKAVSQNSPWRWRRICCIPTIVMFEINYACFAYAAIVLCLYYDQNYYKSVVSPHVNDFVIQWIFVCCSSILTLCIVSNLYAFGVFVKSLLISPRTHVQRAVSILDTVRSEGFLQTLRSEVVTLVNMVRCFDGFTNQQSRLVIVVDGLDSCEQDKVLLILDAVHVLFSDSNTPFIIILAIDPHVISMVVETNTRRLLNESNITGRDFLRNMVHVPFYLQNSGLRKVKIAQRCALQRKSLSNNHQSEETVARRMSIDSMMGSSEKLKVPGTSGGSVSNLRKSSRKLKISESVNSSVASNMNKLSGAQDLTRILTADDYFSDMNPRSMRRLLNIVYIMGRLLKAFQIDFSWYQLAVWVNIVEQWPYRISCLILYHDSNEDSIEESMSLKALYDKIRPYLPTSKELEPLLEFDRDEKKFNVFLKYHKSTLLVNDLRVFLPFTINLDPYIRKVIKEEQQYLEDRGLLLNMGYPGFGVDTAYPPWPAQPPPAALGIRKGTTGFRRRGHGILKTTAPPGTTAPSAPGPSLPITQPVLSTSSMVWPHSSASMGLHSASWLQNDFMRKADVDSTLLSAIPEEFHRKKLSSLSVDGVCELLCCMKDLQASSNLTGYVNNVRQNNISGRVLSFCNLEELKKVMGMTFGDWELFQSVVLTMRELEYLNQWQDSGAGNGGKKPPPHKGSQTYLLERTGSFSKNVLSGSSTGGQDQRDGSTSGWHNAKQTTMEKQVSMEDQMLCGALQTLNEEACEDVMLEGPDSKDETNLVSGGSLNIPDCEPEIIIIDKSSLNQQDFINQTNDYPEAEFMMQETVHSDWRPVFTSQQNIASQEHTSSGSANSVCSAPLVKSKKVFQFEKERKKSLKSKSRPSSLLISKADDNDVSLSQQEMSNLRHNAVVRSASVDGSNTRKSYSTFGNILSGSAKIRRSSTCAGPASAPPPVLSFTAATSGEGSSDASDDDDESTPLVSDATSPLQADNNLPSLKSSKMLSSNVRFLTTPSSAASPSSMRSDETRETPCRSSPDSLDQPYCQLAYVNEKNLGSATEPNNISEAKRNFSWSDTETTV